MAAISIEALKSSGFAFSRWCHELIWNWKCIAGVQLHLPSHHDYKTRINNEGWFCIHSLHWWINIFGFPWSTSIGLAKGRQLFLSYSPAFFPYWDAVSLTRKKFLSGTSPFWRLVLIKAFHINISHVKFGKYESLILKPFSTKERKKSLNRKENEPFLTAWILHDSSGSNERGPFILDIKCPPFPLAKKYS